MSSEAAYPVSPLPLHISTIREHEIAASRRVHAFPARASRPVFFSGCSLQSFTGDPYRDTRALQSGATEACNVPDTIVQLHVSKHTLAGSIGPCTEHDAPGASTFAYVAYHTRVSGCLTGRFLVLPGRSRRNRASPAVWIAM